MSHRYLITGASRGVGRGLADALAARGDEVIGCSRSGSDLTRGSYEDVIMDVTDAAAVAAVFAGLRERSALPDVVVLGAGVASASPALFQSPAAFRDVLDANVVGAFTVAREALHGMLRAGAGRIVFLSSINTRLHSPGGLAYNASKAAVEEMTRTLARECTAGDVTVNALGLSLVAGEGMAAALTESEVARKSAQLPRPEPVGIPEIVHALDFLVAPAARSVTGQVIFFGGAA